MSLEIYITAKANEDAITIADYLAEKASLNTSDKFLQATTQAYRQLAEFPGMGSLRDYGPEFTGLRMWPVPKFLNYLIFYRATDTTLRIERVLHGAQSIRPMFKPSES
jgi:plasmid stabilization system protein ParE